MNDESKPKSRMCWSGAFFSSKYFLVRAAVIGVLFLIAHLAGLRDYTTFVTGTTGNPNVSLQLSALYGSIYLVLYMGCVVLAPIFVLAAGLLMVWERAQAKLKPQSTMN